MNEHFDLATAREGARKIAEARREARRDFERYGKEAAEAERDYRKRKAQAFAEARANDDPVTAAEIFANGESAELRLKRDLARSLAKSAELRIGELEANRAMLREFAGWSQRLEGVPEPQWSDGDRT